jgi:hypothetical protein
MAVAPMVDNRHVDFKEVKDRADFRAVLAHYGITPIGQHDQTKIRCPFHDDAKPSCSVHLGKGLWRCHTGCGSGNALDFVHRMEIRDGATVTLRQAGLTLAAIRGERPGGDGTAHQSRQEGRGEAGKGKTAHRPAPQGLVRVLRLLLALERMVRGRRRPSATSRSGSRSRSIPRTRT